MNPKRLTIATLAMLTLILPVNASAQTVERSLDLGALNIPGLVDVRPIDDDGNVATEAWLLERTIDYVRHFQLVTIGVNGACFERPFAPSVPAGARYFGTSIYTHTLEWQHSQQMLRIRYDSPFWVGDNIVDLIKLDRILCP